MNPKNDYEDSDWIQLYDEPEDYEMAAADELLGSEE